MNIPSTVSSFSTRVQGRHPQWQQWGILIIPILSVSTVASHKRIEGSGVPSMEARVARVVMDGSKETGKGCRFEAGGIRNAGNNKNANKLPIGARSEIPWRTLPMANQTIHWSLPLQAPSGILNCRSWPLDGNPWELERIMKHSRAGYSTTLISYLTEIAQVLKGTCAMVIYSVHTLYDCYCARFHTHELPLNVIYIPNLYLCTYYFTSEGCKQLYKSRAAFHKALSQFSLLLSTIHKVPSPFLISLYSSIP